MRCHFEENAEEEGLEYEIEDNYMADIIEAKIESAIFSYECAPDLIDTEPIDDNSSQ